MWRLVGWNKYVFKNVYKPGAAAAAAGASSGFATFFNLAPAWIAPSNAPRPPGAGGPPLIHHNKTKNVKVLQEIEQALQVLHMFTWSWRRWCNASGWRGCIHIIEITRQHFYCKDGEQDVRTRNPAHWWRWRSSHHRGCYNESQITIMICFENVIELIATETYVEDRQLEVELKETYQWEHDIS